MAKEKVRKFAIQRHFNMKYFSIVSNWSQKNFLFFEILLYTDNWYGHEPKIIFSEWYVILLEMLIFSEIKNDFKNDHKKPALRQNIDIYWFMDKNRLWTKTIYSKLSKRNVFFLDILTRIHEQISFFPNDLKNVVFARNIDIYGFINKNSLFKMI